MITQHGTLRTVVVDPNNPQLHVVNVYPGTWRLEKGARADNRSDALDPRLILRDIFDQQCNPFASPSHQLCVVVHDNDHGQLDSETVTGCGKPGGDYVEDATIVLGFDHSHSDAWSLLLTIRDFTTLLDAIVRGDDPAVALEPTLSFGEHSQQLLDRNEAPNHVVEKWHEHLKSGHMPVFPGDLGDVSQPREQVVDVIEVLDAQGLARFEDAAARRNCSMLGLAVAAMAPVRAVFPIHSRRQPSTPAGTWENALGWFITNSILDCPEANLDRGGTTRVKEAIRDAIQLGSYPLAPIMEPWGGAMPPTEGMFALSWLDNRKLPVDIEPGLEPQHISADIKTNGVMAWFVSNDDGMHLRVRYPDTPQARHSVPAWCQRVVATIRSQCSEPQCEALVV
ncbi:hypothetical protein GC425_09560 [Corynebacterium sp. zg254]|uniref:Condensation domain-containing protein n=1 Tax=Corynebacterium zhongnanshanii TaxID=2768834 RepID=A0ABQ6VBW0_9CORY|nr:MULTISPECIES: hypothetical protein [Corynebacterium]KAB3519231.1 hypothetical protein F8377_09590 [Corynebacterium zhongnanshanii]MCR5915086.1 hypothetical protein [Corynebacterium sp. zg254]